jgi:hypothetical protein
VRIFLTDQKWRAERVHVPMQVCILDGNKYNARCREVGEQRLEILEECEVLHNQKRDPLLHSSACKNDYHHPQARDPSSLWFSC